MYKTVWIFQIEKDKQRKGADRASWYVGWYNHHGNRQGDILRRHGRSMVGNLPAVVVSL